MPLIRISFNVSIETNNTIVENETAFLTTIELAISKWWDELHQGKQETPDLYAYKIIDSADE